MTRDVYAGDQGPVGNRDAADATRLTRIVILSDEAPDVLLRVAVALAVLNSAPERMVLQKEPENLLRIDILIRGFSEVSVDMVRRKLAQLTSVVDVTVVRVS